MGRMAFWKLGVYVAEDDARLMAWTDQIKDWAKDLEEEEARKKKGEMKKKKHG